MSRSSIEWTEATWNPVTGCSKASAGCANCYAERMAMRLKAMGQPNYLNGFSVTMHERTLELPLTWRKPRTVFVNSMGDLFHDEVDADFIRRVFDVMDRAVLAQVSGAYEARGAACHAGRYASVARACLDGRDRRERSLHLSHRSFTPSAGRDPLHLNGASAWAGARA